MTNKVIWITGASSGIGKALAIKFSNEGWQVAASARRENLLNELNKKYPNIHSFALDVTDSEKCKTISVEILNKLENIEICVFCTGIHDPQSEKKFSLEKIRKIMETNFFGTINSINCIIDYYKEKNIKCLLLSMPKLGGKTLVSETVYRIDNVKNLELKTVKKYYKDSGCSFDDYLNVSSEYRAPGFPCQYHTFLKANKKPVIYQYIDQKRLMELLVKLKFKVLFVKTLNDSGGSGYVFAQKET